MVSRTVPWTFLASGTQEGHVCLREDINAQGKGVLAGDVITALQVCTHMVPQVCAAGARSSGGGLGAGNHEAQRRGDL